MSISLPSGIKRGQLYQLVVRQLTNAEAKITKPPPVPELAARSRGDMISWRSVLGSFQINIPVSTRELMLETEELRYSIFQWIAASIPMHSRWHKVFRRYLDLLGPRLRELGGDPSRIRPSQNGYDGLPELPGRPSRPRPESRPYELTGKVEGIVYDHFGDFVGFILKLQDGELRRFESHER